MNPLCGFYWLCRLCHNVGSFPSYTKELPLIGACCRCGQVSQVDAAAVVKWLQPGDRYYNDPESNP